MKDLSSYFKIRKHPSACSFVGTKKGLGNATEAIGDLLNSILVKRVEYRDPFERKFFKDQQKCEAAFALIGHRVNCVIQKVIQPGEEQLVEVDEEMEQVDTGGPNYQQTVGGVSFQVFHFLLISFTPT